MNNAQSIFGTPKEGPTNKVRSFMVPWVMEFISNSSFLVMASSNSTGECDASPKGGKPGFVKVLNTTQLLIPDVAGNKLFQSYENFETNPQIGLVFFIPAITATARVNGKVEVLRKGDKFFDQLSLEVFTPDENSTLLQAVLVTVEQSYSHCPRSLSFSKLWDKETIENNMLAPPIHKWKPGT